MKKLNPMVSMELDDDDKYDDIAAPSKPDYPWGLRICLTEKEFKKLDLDPADAVVGGIVHLHALARITSVSMEKRADANSCRCEMTIENMSVESEDAEND